MGLRDEPIGFAHRGARAHAPENTIEAFELALRLGATGLESDVWLTADGVPVLDHDGVVRNRLRRRRIADVTVDELPDHIPSLETFYAEIDADVEVSLDIKDPEAFGPTVAVAEAAGAADRLWCCHPDWSLVATWRDRSDEIRLVDSTRIGKIKEGPERRASDLQQVGIDAINMHHTDWTAGLVTLFHRFGRACLGWDAQLPRVLEELLAAGLDGVFSDHVDRMVDAISAR